ncbi:NAD(P)-binding protein [Pseudoalteromonas espejiana]
MGILGGGTAGATIAIRLAALGIHTTVFEKKSH